MAGDWIGDTGDIVFVSRRGEAALGSGSLWRYRGATEAVELLIRIETNYQAAPVVAPHGGIVAYVTDSSGNNDLYAVPSEKSPRGIQPVRLTHTRTDEYFPSWSPDGERLVYARNGGAADQPRTTDNGMGFGLYTVTRGGGTPKPVRIDGYAWSGPTGQLRVRVSDSDGEPLPSRIYLTGSDGRAHFPHSSYPRVVSVTEDYYFHTDGSFSVTLPVGEATVEAWRGFEYEPVSRAAQISAGEHTTVELQLDRWIDMAADGWYSGDNHIHPNYGGHYFVTPDDLRNKAHAEDLNVANGMIANYWGNSRVEDLEHFLGHPHPHTGPRTIVYYNEEYRPSFFAHLSLLNLTELITPFYIGSVGTAHHALYPDNASVLRRVHEQGGIGGYVHPYGLRHRDPDAAGAGSAQRTARGRDSRSGRLRGRGVHLERRTRHGRGLVPPPQHRFAHPRNRRNRCHDGHLAASRGRDDARLRVHGGGPRPLRRLGRRHGGGPHFCHQRADPDARRIRKGHGRGTGRLPRRRGHGARDGAVALHDARPGDHAERPHRAPDRRDR